MAALNYLLSTQLKPNTECVRSFTIFPLIVMIHHMSYIRVCIPVKRQHLTPSTTDLALEVHLAPRSVHVHSVGGGLEGTYVASEAKGLGSRLDFEGSNRLSTHGLCDAVRKVLVDSGPHGDCSKQ